MECKNLSQEKSDTTVFCIKFHGESEGNGLEAHNQCLDRKMKICILKCKLRENLNHHFWGKFHGESKGDGLEAQKRCFNLELAMKA